MRGKISFDCDLKLQGQVIALSYLYGEGGYLPPMCRRIFAQGVEELMLDMTKDQKTKFQQVFDTVMVELNLRVQVKLEKVKEELSDIEALRRQWEFFEGP